MTPPLECNVLADRRGRRRGATGPNVPSGPRSHHDVVIPVPGPPSRGGGEVHLAGTLGLPTAPRGLVVFAHGSGSSRHSPRNRYVADGLVDRGHATLLFDLLSDDEARSRRNVFDIPLLAERLLGATRWVGTRPELRDLRVGYFGASTGAAAALVAASEPSAEIAAIVSRGGRPDLAGAAIGAVRAPTLLLVGGLDHEVARLNEAARQRLGGPSRLQIVRGAGHLFEEPGTLEVVARAAGEWFDTYLATGPTST
jgi:putative phosphoribosyl transferase